MPCKTCGTPLFAEEQPWGWCRAHTRSLWHVWKLGPIPELYRTNRLAWLLRMAAIASERWPSKEYGDIDIMFARNQHSKTLRLNVPKIDPVTRQVVGREDRDFRLTA